MSKEEGVLDKGMMKTSKSTSNLKNNTNLLEGGEFDENKVNIAIKN